jgi:hypothetical protein
VEGFGWDDLYVDVGLPAGERHHVSTIDFDHVHNQLIEPALIFQAESFLRLNGRMTNARGIAVLRLMRETNGARSLLKNPSV